jgi:hypothetical protein
MITVNELKLGNRVLKKSNNKIGMVSIDFTHFEQLSKDSAFFYPVALKPEILQKNGFKENGDYALLPQAREFIMALPVPGSHKTEICAYVKNNGECFFRATVNRLPASNNFFFLHQLQNLYFCLTGEELLMQQ